MKLFAKISDPGLLLKSLNEAGTAFYRVVEKGLIEFHETKTRIHGGRDYRILGLYKITDKGRAVLQQLEALEMELVG